LPVHQVSLGWEAFLVQLDCPDVKVGPALRDNQELLEILVQLDVMVPQAFKAQKVIEAISLHSLHVTVRKECLVNRDCRVGLAWTDRQARQASEDFLELSECLD